VHANLQFALDELTEMIQKGALHEHLVGFAKIIVDSPNSHEIMNFVRLFNALDAIGIYADGFLYLLIFDLFCFVLFVAFQEKKKW
jgi:hypothetical protein